MTRPHALLTHAQHSTLVEDAFRVHPQVRDVAAVGVPDERLGELVAAIVSIDPGFFPPATEQELIEVASKR